MAAYFAATSKEDQDCKMQTWSLAQRGGHFFRAFEPPHERGVHNAPDVSRIIAFEKASPTFRLYSFTTNDQPLCYIRAAFLNYPL